MVELISIGKFYSENFEINFTVYLYYRGYTILYKSNFKFICGYFQTICYVSGIFKYIDVKIVFVFEIPDRTHIMISFYYTQCAE